MDQKKPIAGRSLIQASFVAVAELAVVKPFQKESTTTIDQALSIRVLADRSLFVAIVHYYNNMFLFSKHVFDHRIFRILSLNDSFESLSMKFFVDKSLSTCTCFIDKSLITSKFYSICLIQVAASRQRLCKDVRLNCCILVDNSTNPSLACFKCYSERHLSTWLFQSTVLCKLSAAITCLFRKTSC